MDPRIHLRMGSPGHLCKTLLLGTCTVLVSHAGTVRKNHLTLERKPKDSLWNPGSEVCMTHYATPTNIQVLMRHIHPGKPVPQIFHICDIQQIDGCDKILPNKDMHDIQQKSHFPFLSMKIKSVCCPSESTCIEIHSSNLLLSFKVLLKSHRSSSSKAKQIKDRSLCFCFFFLTEKIGRVK